MLYYPKGRYNQMNFKKNIKKIIAGVSAGALIVSATACTPISSSAEWSYKLDKNEKAMGVYIYSLYNAYNQAKTYAEKAEGYDEKESFLDLEITDDKGEKAVASEWIKKEADIAVREMLFLDKTLADKKATIDEATYDKQANEDWELGYMYSMYSQYGYATTPEQEILEPYGISKDSYTQVRYYAPAEQQKLFDLMYQKGGTEEVSDKELAKFFDESYTYYSYFTIPLYEQTTDEDGNQTSKAYDSKKQTNLTKQANTYAKAITGGSTVDKECEKYLKANKIEAELKDTVVTNCELLEEDNLANSSIGEEVAKELLDVKVGDAKVITIGQDDTKTIYVVQKLNTKNAEKEYLTKDDSTRSTVLQNMKKDDFSDYLEEEAKKLDCEVNSTVEKYDSEMFWSEPEETTTQSESNSKQ